MKDDIIKKLFQGEIIPVEQIHIDSEVYNDYMSRVDDIRIKVKEAVINIYGKEYAKDLEDEYIEIISAMSKEETLEAFRMGFHIGFEFAEAVIKE